MRKLVLGNSPSIRWLPGTAKGLEVSKDNLDRVTGVEVRLPDNTEKVIPAALVVGKYGVDRFSLLGISILYVHRFFLTNSFTYINYHYF